MKEIFEIENDLEKMIDIYSLNCVLSVISKIAWQKALHIVENYQDRSAAYQWEKIGDDVSALRSKFES